MKKVIYDQDGLGERDHNLYGLLVLLQAPGVELVGLTTVSGREWSPRQTPRALEVLRLLNRSKVTVAPGAVFPLINSVARTARWEHVHGPLFDAMCLDQDPDNPPSDLDPFWLPPPAPGSMPVSLPTEHAAVFMTRMARKYPGEISIVATGPLTNLALAIRLDPEFPRLVKEVFFVGGRFMPYSKTGQFSRAPGRREPNLRHDPEAAHIVLTAEWGRGGLTCLPRDLTDTVHVTRQMHEKIAHARTPIGRFIKTLPHDLYAKGDALAAAVFAAPALIKTTDAVCLDVDLSNGPSHGCLINWRDETFAPKGHASPIRIVTAIHEKPFAQNILTWCTARQGQDIGILTQGRQGRKARKETATEQLAHAA